MAAWTESDIPNLTGGLAVVTGANSGLGFETTRALGQHGAKVIMACRDPAKAQAAAARLQALAPKGQFEVLPLDLADLDSVRAFAKTLTDRNARINFLINNAGVMAIPLARTRQGFETQIGANHLGHFALTGLLIDRIAPEGRIVNLSSLMHKRSKGLDFSDLNRTRRPYKPWAAYADSKLANLLFSAELARRAAQSGLTFTVATAHPGFSNTNLQFVAAEIRGSKTEAGVMRFINSVFAQSAANGAAPTLYAATSSEVGSDDYIGPDGFMEMRGAPRKLKRSKPANDVDAQHKLWTMSEELTGIRYLDA